MRMFNSTDVLAREGCLSTRVITAKTVNEELHALARSCEKIRRRLLGKPNCQELRNLLAKQETKLALVISAALDGRQYRHRG